MPPSSDLKHAETLTKMVYGSTFARYDEQQFLDFLRPLEKRLAAHGIDESVFEGKRCLDAGCGGGRATVLMARAGAREVVAYDLSEQNVETTRRNVALFGLQNVTVRCASLLELPDDDQAFDTVWCNGVIHHAVNPDLALREVVRVLTVGGRLWLYLYGSGGIYWAMVDFIRDWLGGIDVETCISRLERIGTPADRIAEFIDDWFVPNLKRYTDADVVRRLHELGMIETERLEHGMPYDTCVRRRDPVQRDWMGEGDLRYWASKSSHVLHPDGPPLPEGKGSAYSDSPAVGAFLSHFERLRQEPLSPERRVEIAARMQTRLRDTLSAPGPFDAQAWGRESFWVDRP